MEGYTPETVNVLDHKGHTPLEVACLTPSKRMYIPLLLAMGADVNHPRIRTCTIFTRLCRGCRPDLILALFNAGMTVNFDTRVIPRHVAYAASAYRLDLAAHQRAWKEIIVILLKQGCNPTHKLFGLTALDYVCMRPSPYRSPSKSRDYRTHFHLDMIDLIYQAGQTGLASRDAVMRHVGADTNPFPVDHANADAIYTSSREGLAWYLRLIGRCGAATVAILGLLRVGSQVARGNNRDVLGIVGGMVWSSRCETEWGAKGDGVKRVKQ